MSTISDALNRVMDGTLPVSTRERVSVGSLQRVAFVPETRAVDTKSRRITFVSSKESVDRYGDSIKVSGWDTKNYMRNPVFLWAHRSQDPPIGKCVSIITEMTPTPALLQTIEFADASTYPFADSIFNLYRGGFLKSVSVGFRPTVAPKPLYDAEGFQTGGMEFNGQELLELSAVPLPANPDAVARMISDGTVTKADAERIFKPVEQPAADEELLLNLLRKAKLEMLSLSVSTLELAVALYSIRRGRDEITTIEQLLADPTSIESLTDLEKLLRGEN